MLRKAPLAVCLAAIAAGATAADINVPADQPTIQLGIDAAMNGDRVVVAPGTYFENIDFDGKHIELVSARGPKLTVIDGSGKDTVVSFTHGETRDSVLSGFQIRHGGSYYTQLGGAVKIEGASPTVYNNDIYDNTACTAAGIYASGHSAVRIVHNHIHDNYLSCTGSGEGIGGGGGMHLDYAEGAIIEDNFIEHNGGWVGGGISLVEENGLESTRDVRGGWVTVARNVIRQNGAAFGGGGLYARVTRLRLVDNVIVSNGYDNAEIDGNNDYPPVIYIVNNTFAGADVADLELNVHTGRLAFLNNIISSTVANTWSINCYDDGAHANISNNLIYATNGATIAGDCDLKKNLIGDDPLFVGGGDVHAYWLSSGSPAIDAGDNAAVKRIRKDASGAPRIVDGTVDLGAYEYRNN